MILTIVKTAMKAMPIPTPMPMPILVLLASELRFLSELVCGLEGVGEVGIV